MHLLVDISAHGLGHLAQMGPVLNVLHERLPGMRLTVRSGLPLIQLRRRIVPTFEHLHETSDFGYVMHNAVDIDLEASARRYRDFHQNWPQRIADEAARLVSHQVDAVLTDVAYLPLAAAAKIGIPAASVCSLNWADLFLHYFSGETWAASIHGEILAAYNAANGFIRTLPGMPMADLRNTLTVAPIARLGLHDRTSIGAQLGLNPADRWVLVALGGIEFRLPVEDWPSTPGMVWLVPRAWQVHAPNVCAFDTAEVDFTDLLASVDAVLTKPGYGTFAEAACNGIPVLYVSRGDWPEEPYLVAWLTAHGRAREVSRDDLISGNFVGLLESLWRQSAPATPLPAGASEAVTLLLGWLDLDAD